jgi:hypothetical protein
MSTLGPSADTYGYAVGAAAGGLPRPLVDFIRPAPLIHDIGLGDATTGYEQSAPDAGGDVGVAGLIAFDDAGTVPPTVYGVSVTPNMGVWMSPSGADGTWEAASFPTAAKYYQAGRQATFAAIVPNTPGDVTIVAGDNFVDNFAAAVSPDSSGFSDHWGITIFGAGITSYDISSTDGDTQGWAVTVITQPTVAGAFPTKVTAGVYPDTGCFVEVRIFRFNDVHSYQSEKTYYCVPGVRKVSITDFRPMMSAGSCPVPRAPVLTAVPELLANTPRILVTAS